MATWVSKEGVWYPAKERVALRNLSNETRTVDGKEVQPDEDYIYEGPYRQACFELWEQKVDTLGTDFRTDPDFIENIRKRGFDSVDKFLEFIGYDPKKADDEFKKKATKVTTHAVEKNVKENKLAGGGVDMSGNQETRYGGFGRAPEN